MRIAFTGATGFIGRETVIHLARQGHEVTALVRNENSASDLPCQVIRWDAESGNLQSLVAALKGMDAVINLAGEPIANGRWTSAIKKKLESSRLHGTQKLVEALSLLPEIDRPQVLISASATGYYGSCGDEILNEESDPGTDYLAKLSLHWETEATQAEKLGLRVIRLRTGIVLGAQGGALQKMQPVVLGSGKQWMSWIHLTDVARLIEFALTNEKMSGAYNVTAPNPVRNRDFTLKLAKARGFPVVATVPRFIFKILLGEMSDAILASCNAVPTRALQQGFSFQYPTIDQALHQIYRPDHRLEQTYSVTQFVPKPIEEVFSYFSRAENLEELTPPWLNFHIVSKSTASTQENTLLDYSLKIHGIPTRWQSRIERWRPNQEFVDTQTHGPYTQWHHTHRFEKVAHGTLILDDVIYQVPGGSLGKIFLSHLVRHDLIKIFSFRKKKVIERFHS